MATTKKKEEPESVAESATQEKRLDAEQINIYTAINRVMRDIGNIGKDKTNKHQGWNFRSIDQVYDALYPALSEHGVFVVPALKEHHWDLHNVNGKGKFHTHVTVEYTFYAPDGSSVLAIAPGESFTGDDKGTTIAMSYAFKAACFQIFCIPLDPDLAKKERPDGDFATPEIPPPPPIAPPPAPMPSAPPVPPPVDIPALKEKVAEAMAQAPPPPPSTEGMNDTEKLIRGIIQEDPNGSTANLPPAVASAVVPPIYPVASPVAETATKPVPQAITVETDFDGKPIEELKDSDPMDKHAWTEIRAEFPEKMTDKEFDKWVKDTMKANARIVPKKLESITVLNGRLLLTCAQYSRETQQLQVKVPDGWTPTT